MVSRNILLRSSLLLLLLIVILVAYDSVKTGSQIYAEGDLDKDGITEKYVLTNKVLTVREGKNVVWKSPHDYDIDSFSLGDINNDGKVNLVISLWKKGSFGEFKPFWHTRNDNTYKNHLFVYQLQKNTFKPVWCSSNLDRPILSLAINDNNGDGLNELIVEEGQYKRTFGTKYSIDPKVSEQTVIWQWEEWGFRLAETPSIIE